MRPTYEGSAALNLLRELADSPPSALRRAQPIGLQDILYPAASQHLRVRGWEVVERLLPDAIREELALLLGQASQLTFHVEGRVFLDPRDAKGRKRVVDPARWRSDLHAWLQTDEAFEGPYAGAAALLRSTMEVDGATPSSLDLAVAALRLYPHDALRIVVAQRQAAMGHYDRSMELNQSVLQVCDTGFLAAYAWSNMAVVLSKRGRYLDATDAARRGAWAAPNLLRGIFNWFTTALQAGDSRQSLRAAGMVEEFVAEDSSELEDILHVVRTERSNGFWKPTQAASDVCRKMVIKTSPSVSRICDEFN